MLHLKSTCILNWDLQLPFLFLNQEQCKKNKPKYTKKCKHIDKVSFLAKMKNRAPKWAKMAALHYFFLFLSSLVSFESY